MSRKVFERYLTEEEVKALLKTVGQYSNIHAQRDHAWMRLLLQTGLRVQTLSGLNVGDAKAGLRNGYIYLRPEIMKGRREHQLFLTKKAQKALRDLLNIRQRQGYGAGAEHPLIYSRQHGRMAIRSFEHRTRYWAEAAGIKRPVTPHWFRHTVAKRIIANSTGKNPMLEVQRVLGHGSLEATAIYTKPDREDIERAMEESL